MGLCKLLHTLFKMPLRYEDFAESWSAYSEARESGREALSLLHQQFPERCKILDCIWERAQNQDYGQSWL